jgi:phosphoglycolate phosphatase-like HAD superfamily hydrolase
MNTSSENPIIIFDVDGTLLRASSSDWDAFGEAVEAATGRTLTPEFIENLPEVTAQSIIRALISDLPEAEQQAQITQAADNFAGVLEWIITQNPGAFFPSPGASELLSELSTRGFDRAIATGDWQRSIALKFACTELPWCDLPMATSTDRPTRASTITLAAERAGRSVSDAIYVGDGLWDHRAAGSLGIPFIGVGLKHEKLRAAGATHVLPDLTPGPFFETLDSLLANLN